MKNFKLFTAFMCHGILLAVQAGEMPFTLQENPTSSLPIVTHQAGSLPGNASIPSVVSEAGGVSNLDSSTRAEAEIRDVVNRVMKPYIFEQNLAGAIVGVSWHGKRYFFNYGRATEDGRLFTPDTLVEIGSCTKVFTTTLFALAIDRKQIEPNASVQNYMPKGYTLRQEARAVTPLELADFTSGLPDDPPNLPEKLEQRSIEHYTTHDFLTWISNWTPKTPLPAPFLYSNAGIGLLSYLIMTATGKEWKDQLKTEILDRFDMRDTTLYPTPEQRKRLAQGHLRNGQVAPIWPVYAWYAAGSLRSTARDMLSFAEANIGRTMVNGTLVPEELTRAMKLAQKPIYTLPQVFNKQAMAWINNEGVNQNLEPVIVKDGETAGFSSALAISPSKDLAVFISINQAGASPVAKGIDIARQIRNA